jgi:O-antigen ligase
VRRPDWAPGEPGRGGGALAVAQGALLALSFTLPFSIALTEGALILGLIALSVSVARGRRLTIAPSWLLPASALLVACWLVSSAFSQEPASSFFHVRKLYALLLIVLAAEATREPNVRRRVVPLLLAGAILTTAVGLLIYAVSVTRDPGYRMKSLLSNQMTSGGVLAGALLWALGQAAGRRDGRRWIYAALLIPLALGLVLTQTRSHWLGAAVGAVVILVALAPRWWWTVPVAFAALARFGPPRLVARLYSIVDPHDPGNQGRLSMWRSGLDIIRDHPWIGVGCQDLLALYRRYRYPDWTFESGHFHNNFVQIAVMTGVIGLLAFVFWLVAAARQLLRGRRAARGGPDVGLAASALAVFAALLVSGLFDFTFGDAEVVYQSYLAIGLACALLASQEGSGAAAGGPQP